MKSRNCSSVSKRSAALALLGYLIVLSSFSAGATASGASTGAIYTASDFPRLAQGVDLDFSGTAFVSVWAPGDENWQMTSEGGTITLKKDAKPGDPAPRWQRLGQVDLAKSRSVKLIVSSPPAKAAPKGKSAEARKEEQVVPTPALLWISSSGHDSTESTPLDLVRGRVDSASASHDTRRSYSRTNDEGADFQAPASPPCLARSGFAFARTNADLLGIMANVRQDPIERQDHRQA